MGNIAPVVQEAKEQSSILNVAAHPNSTAVAQALYQNAPPVIKGQLETRMNTFKGPMQNGNQIAYNPNHLAEHQATIARTPTDIEYRKLGLTSLSEARQRDINYLSGQESKRLKAAQEASVKYMMDAVIRGDKGDVQDYAQAFFKNEGDINEFNKLLNQRIMDSNLTPEQRAYVHANTLGAAMSVMRRIQMQQRNK